MTSIAFAPMFDWIVLAAVGALGLAVLAAGAFTRARGLAWRTLAIAALWLALANPALVDEEREPIPDLVTIVVDESESQRIDGRRQRSEETLEILSNILKKFDNLDIRIVRTGADQSVGARAGTRLFEALGRSLSSTSQRRIAGTILLTDGQVHDVPPDDAAPRFAGPCMRCSTASPASTTGSSSSTRRRASAWSAPRRRSRSASRTRPPPAAGSGSPSPATARRFAGSTPRSAPRRRSTSKSITPGSTSSSSRSTAGRAN